MRGHEARFQGRTLKILYSKFLYFSDDLKLVLVSSFVIEFNTVYGTHNLYSEFTILCTPWSFFVRALFSRFSANHQSWRLRLENKKSDIPLLSTLFFNYIQ